MTRVNVYLPDELADRARAAGLNVSGLTQQAVRSALSRRVTREWLNEVASLSPTAVRHEDVLRVVDEAKGELEGIG